MGRVFTRRRKDAPSEPDPWESESEYKAFAEARREEIAREQVAAQKLHGRYVLCGYCSARVRIRLTERIKPLGSTRYERLCPKCAPLVKAAKLLRSRKKGL